MGLMAGAEGQVKLARMAFAPPSAQASAKAAMPKVAEVMLSQARTPIGPSRASTALWASAKGRLRSSRVNEPTRISGKTRNSPLLMERNAGRVLRASSRHKSDWAGFLLFIEWLSLANLSLVLQACLASGAGATRALFDLIFTTQGGAKTDILPVTRNRRIPLRKYKGKW